MPVTLSLCFNFCSFPFSFFLVMWRSTKSSNREKKRTKMKDTHSSGFEAVALQLFPDLSIFRHRYILYYPLPPPKKTDTFRFVEPLYLPRYPPRAARCKKAQPGGCLLILALVLPPPSTCSPAAPLVIFQGHSGGKAFHLLNKVEGCHNTGV